jgi:rod shape-determining protein MreD
VRRAVLSVVVLAVALTAQLTIVNRLPLPGTGAPDLVLLAVVALGFCSRPATAAVTGFCAGLCLDIAPPGSYLIGEYALVFCLVGYLCGRIRGLLNQSATLTIVGAMGAAAAGEALVALLGMAVSDPQVSWPAVQQVLPSSVIYDVVVTPFLLYLVMRAVRWADALGRDGVAEGQPADGSALLARSLGASGALSGSALPGATVLGGAGLLGGAGWLAGPVGSRGSGGRPSRGRGKPHVPSTPRLREAAARSGDGWVGGGPRPRLTASAGLTARRPPLARRPGRPPRLRPGAGTPGSAVARPPRALPRSPANLRIGGGRRGDGSLGRALGSRPGGLGAAALRGRTGGGPPGSAFRGRRPTAGRPGAARSGAVGRGASSGGPRFRPDTRLPGGSSNDSPLRSAALQRGMPSRRVSLRLGSARRHDGVLGGGALRGGALRGGALRGGVLAGRSHRGLGVRPVSLRLGSGRRGDGALGGLSGGRPSWARPRLSSQRRREPRFRSSPAIGGHSLLGKRAGLRAGKRARFGSGRSSFLATWTGGRLGGRSTVWRIGSKRTGGFR